MLTIDARPRSLVLDPAATAVIVVDKQNDFGAEQRMFHRAGIPISGIQAAVAPTARRSSSPGAPRASASSRRCETPPEEGTAHADPTSIGQPHGFRVGSLAGRASLWAAAGMSAAALALPASAAARADFQTATSAAQPAQPRMSVCRPVRVNTPSGMRMTANCRLARIERGTVPCLHQESAERITCRFTRSSGRWLQGRYGGRYALAGQAVTRTGKPGGNYVVASKLDRNGRPACVAGPRRLTASAADSAGTSASMELARGCMTEVLGSASNVTGLELDNYATREVCTSSFPHPDAETFVRRAADGSYCYTGEGAGLNDRDGTERDQYGRYFTKDEYCHVLWSSGAEVPAAKRPATSTYPAPGRVRTDTPILWRPVSTVTIANG